MNPGGFRSEKCNFPEPESIQVTRGILLLGLRKSVCIGLFFVFKCVVTVTVLSKILQSSQKSTEPGNSTVLLTRQRDLHLSSLPTFKEAELG